MFQDGLPKNKLQSICPTRYIPYLPDLDNKMREITLYLERVRDIAILIKILAARVPMDNNGWFICRSVAGILLCQCCQQLNTLVDINGFELGFCDQTNADRNRIWDNQPKEVEGNRSVAGVRKAGMGIGAGGKQLGIGMGEDKVYSQSRDSPGGASCPCGRFLGHPIVSIALPGSSLIVAEGGIAGPELEKKNEGINHGNIAGVVRALIKVILSSKVQAVVVFMGRDSLVAGETVDSMMQQAKRVLQLLQRFQHTHTLYSLFILVVIIIGLESENKETVFCSILLFIIVCKGVCKLAI
jgi:hypothetical protein